jgi:type VI secretion system protein ImpF
MADQIRRNRLSPPLMHVFRAAHEAKDARARPATRAEDEGRDLRASSRQTQRVAITEFTLRREVARDLESLMNSVAMESTVDLTDFPAVRRSILNYGFPDIAHRTMDELEGAGLDAEIEAVLKLYEPRLVAASLRVRRDRNVDPDSLKIRYIVSSDLSCEPLNVPLEFMADIEVTSGKIMIQRL